MTEPGNLNQLVPRGQDWIPRKLADLERLLRRQAGAVNAAPTGGGGIVAFGEFDDPNTSTATTYQIDPSDFAASEGDYASYMAYDNSGALPGVMMTALGWYQVFLHIQVTGLTVGDVVHVRVHWPWAGTDTDAYGIADAVGVSLSLTTLPSKNYSTTGMITAYIDNPGGGTINTAQFHVMFWSGV